MVSPTLLIRDMTSGDLDRVCEIEDVVFPMPWPRATFDEEVGKNPDCLAWVAEKGDLLVAYLIAWIVSDELHIGNLAVIPSERSTGVATELLRSALDGATERDLDYATLEVRVSNENAIALYEKFSFRGVAMQKRYYPDTGEDALVMMRELSAEDQG